MRHILLSHCGNGGANRRGDGSTDSGADRPADDLRHVQGGGPRDGDYRGGGEGEAGWEVGLLSVK